MKGNPALPSAPAPAAEEAYFLTIDGFTAAAQAYALEPLPNLQGNIDMYHLHLLSLVGGQNPLKALRAALRRGDHARLTLQSDDPVAVAEFGWKQCRLANNAGRAVWQPILTRLPQSGLWHLLLYPTYAQPEPDPNRTPGENRTFLLLNPAAAPEPVERYHLFLDRRTDLPLHPYWAAWLWSRSLARNESQELETYGLQAWKCSFDEKALQADLSAAVKSGLLNIPKGEL